MALTIASGYLASDGEVWTPTKQNNSTVPKITLAQNEYMGRISAGVGPVEAVTAAQIKASLTIVPADITLAANSIFGNNTGAVAPGAALTPAQAKALLAIAQADVAGLLTTSSVLFAGLTVQQSVAGPISVFDARNVSGDPAASVKFNIGNDVSGALFEIQVYSSTHANANKAFIYTTGPSDLALGVNGAQNLTFAGATGVATFNAQVNAPVFNATSARRYKKHIARLAPDADKLLALRPVTYDWKDNKSQPFQMGFIAEEVDELFPSLVQRSDGEVQGLNYNGLLAVAFAALQDHEARLRKLEKESALMPSGLKSNGVDLDSILKARTTSPRPDVNVQTDGVDEANRFEKSAGGDTPPVATNFKSATADFQVLFQDINYGGLLYASASVNPSGGNIGNGPFTTVATTITAGGGNPGYSFSWAYVSGDATLVCNAPNSATATWTGSGAAPQTKSAVWRCTVTDAFPHVVTVDVIVTINFYGALSITLNKGSVTGTRIGNGVATSDAVAGSPSGGSGGYSYAWQYLSGATQPQPTSSAGSSTTFAYNGVAVQTFVGTWRLMVQDSLGNQAFSGNVTVTLNFVSATVNVSVDKTFVSGFHSFGGGPQATDVVTGTASGGVAPYSYLWERLSGDTGTLATSGFAAASSFYYPNGFPGDVFTSTWRLRVTDSVSTIGYSNPVDARIEYGF